MPHIILIGPPGAGKSTVGKALARHLKIAFADSDVVIEEKSGMKISDIFITKGEEFFRDLEFDVLNECLLIPDCVLSLGGGAPIAERAQALLVEVDAHLVFLDVSLAIAAARVGFNRDRPILLGNPRAQWQELNEVRRPVYERLATAVIKVEGSSVKELVAQIVEATQ
jgi:shikimate kinase